MRKPIFENDEEAREVLELYCQCSSRDKGIKNTLDNIRRAGYIRRSPVEEAEETYKEFERNLKDNKDYIHFSGLIFKLYEAVQYQKEQISELKKQLE